MKLIFDSIVGDKFPVRLYKADLPLHDFWLYYNGSLLMHATFCNCCKTIFELNCKWLRKES